MPCRYSVYMSKNELVPEVRLNKNNVPVTKWVRRDAAASAASIPAPMGAGKAAVTPADSRPLISWSKGGKLGIALERIFPWSNKKREGLFDRLRSAAMDDTVEGLRSMGRRAGYGSSQSSSLGGQYEPSIRDSEHAVQPFLNATHRVSSKALNYVLQSVKTSESGRGLHNMVPTDYDLDEFSALSGKNMEADFMSVAALRGSGADVRVTKNGLFQMQELRDAHPTFNRPDLFNLTRTEQKQAAAVLDLATHIRNATGRNDNYSHGGDWKDHNRTISPELASYVMKDPSRAEGVKRFFSENAYVSPKEVDLSVIRNYVGS